MILRLRFDFEISPPYTLKGKIVDYKKTTRHHFQKNTEDPQKRIWTCQKNKGGCSVPVMTEYFMSAI